MKKLLTIALLSGLSLSAAAQEGGPEEGDEEDSGPPGGWGWGVAAVVSDSPYAGEGTRVLPLPLFSYQGERFSIRAMSISYLLFEKASFEFSVTGKNHFGGFDVDDLGRQELANNGIDYRLLEDRDGGFDLGLGVKWNGRAGEIELDMTADVTDTSGGQEVNFQYGYPFDVGKGSLTPTIGATWMSEDSANYSYGTLDSEVARGVVNYKPGAATIANFGINYFRPINEKWVMMGSLQYSVLPDEIKNSPLIEAGTDGTSTVLWLFSRGF